MILAVNFFWQSVFLRSILCFVLFFFSSRRRHTRSLCDWSSDVCSSDLRDLTARKEAQDALHRSEQTFQLLVESIQDCAIFMLDPDGRVASWNAAAERIKGYRAHEIMGGHFSTFYPPDDVAQGKPQWALEIAEREGRHEHDGWRVRKAGARFCANSVISPMRDSQGGLIGYAKVTRDLTQRRRADQALAQTSQELERFS